MRILESMRVTIRATDRHMKNLGRASLIGILFSCAALAETPSLPAYDVVGGDGAYRWTHEGKEQGRDDDLAAVIQGAIGKGNREVNLRTSGTLNRTIRLASGLVLNGHGHSFSKSHKGTGFRHEGRGGITVRDLTLNSKQGWGLHFSRASNIALEKLNIRGGGIGIRVDSHPSRAYESSRWVSGLRVKDCAFEGCGSHGLETYGVENFVIDGITAKKCGECGVLVNKGRNGKVGLVRAWRCSVGGGYAGLRFANHCSDIEVKKLVAIECGRGFFTVSNCKNITVDEVDIRNCSSHAILIQHSERVGIDEGNYNGDGLVHYTSKNCWIKATRRDDYVPPRPEK